MTDQWEEFKRVHDPELPVVADREDVRRVSTQVSRMVERSDSERGHRLPKGQEQQLAARYTMDVIVAEGSQRAADGLPMWDEVYETTLATAVIDTLYGLGPLAQVLAEPGLEDVYIAGTGPVRLKLSDGSIEERPPISDTNEGVKEQLRNVATYGTSTERQMVDSHPVIDLRFPGGERAAAMWDVTPVPHVTIRVHRYVDIDLDDLVGMGMLSIAMARFLEAAVRARRSIVVVGPQSAGKTTFLRALARAISPAERFATLESEYELQLHTLLDEQGRERFPLLIPIEARPGSGEIGPDGKPAGEMSIADLFPASLRHSLTRLIIGEMRAEETVPTLMAMARGLRGSLATFHANSARKTFNSLRSAVTLYSKNVSAEAAMTLVADALDLVVCLDIEVDASGRPYRFVREILEVDDEISESGVPASTAIFEPDLNRVEFDPRGYPHHKPSDQLWARRAGFSMSLLDPPSGEWPAPFPRRALA